MQSSSPEAGLDHLGGEISKVRATKLDQTQHLLGDTIRLSDVEWQEASLLPGWTRAHVATHLARNADGLRRAYDGWRSGHPERMYPSEAEREREIERGSQRTGLELQIDLDTSSSLLHAAFNDLEARDPQDSVELRAGFRLPVRLLPLARLSEVTLHRIDLDVGFTAGDIPEPAASWVLDWVLHRLQGRLDLPPLLVHTPSGRTARIGGFGTPREVSGSSSDLLGWLSGRSGGEDLDIDAVVTLPLLG